MVSLRRYAMLSCAACSRLCKTSTAAATADGCQTCLQGLSSAAGHGCLCRCPRVHEAPPISPCEQPTLHQMLTHTSGLWDSQS